MQTSIIRKTDDDLPVGVTVSYKLDGKAVTASEMVAKAEKWKC